jgi:SAM-dependent methyltransferase
LRTQTESEDEYEWSYDKLETHRLMLADDIRNRAYRDALLATVKPGDVVLDFGAGTGILSLFAAQAGAARVYAVERTTIVRVTRRLIRRNGFADSITVIRGDIDHVTLPQPVDVIVSEWLGAFGVDENMLAPLVLARDRWLKPGGRLLPTAVTAWIAPIWNDALDMEMALQSGRPYGLDLSLVTDAEREEVTWAWQRVPEEALAAEPHEMWTTDAATVSAKEASSPFNAHVSVTATRSRRINALTTWFTADFGNEITLTNAPTAPETHWGQYLFPLQKPIDISEGTPIEIEFSCTPAGQGYSTYDWSVRIGDGPWEHHGSRAAS